MEKRHIGALNSMTAQDSGGKYRRVNVGCQTCGVVHLHAFPVPRFERAAGHTHSSGLGWPNNDRKQN